jgi:predicted MFS family arabinose efflux permease
VRQPFATRLAFAVVGVAMAAWAPLVPYAKARLGVQEAGFGGLLLCLGIGSFVAMPLAGILVGRFGCRRTLGAAGVGLCATLPLLAWVDTEAALALALLWFGATLGAFDIAVNVQAVIVEKAAGRAMMSGFHAFFSLGGMLGASGVSILLWFGASPALAALVAMAICLATLLCAMPGIVPRALVQGQALQPKLFVRPSGVVLAMGFLCFVAFLTEGAMLDWSGIFLVAQSAMSVVGAGLGYAIFSLTMTLGRLTGDRVVAKFGPRRVLCGGALCAMAGLALAVALPIWWIALAGFALVGIGGANIVPLIYSALGRQTTMPANLAIAAAATFGYAGILIGPAAIGGVAQVAGLNMALGGVVALLSLVAGSAWVLVF